MNNLKKLKLNSYVRLIDREGVSKRLINALSPQFSCLQFLHIERCPKIGDSDIESISSLKKLEILIKKNLIKISGDFIYKLDKLVKLDCSFNIERENLNETS